MKEQKKTKYFFFAICLFISFIFLRRRLINVHILFYIWAKLGLHLKKGGSEILSRRLRPLISTTHGFFPTPTVVTFFFFCAKSLFRYIHTYIYILSLYNPWYGLRIWLLDNARSKNGEWVWFLLSLPLAEKYRQRERPELTHACCN